MDVILIRSSEVDESIMDEVLGLLQATPGPLRYSALPYPLLFKPEELMPFDITDPGIWTKKIVNRRTAQYSDWDSEGDFNLMTREDVQPAFSASWEVLFSKIESYRHKYAISSEKHLILLTDHHNDNNWFSGFDPSMHLNYFVQTSLWHEFIDGGRRFPVSYECIALPLQRMTSDHLGLIVHRTHQTPKGCMNDFCIEKEQIALKLRTAYICDDCLNEFREKGLSPTLVTQALAVFESIRKQLLFSQRYITTQQPSRLRISGERLDIHLVDLDNTLLPLNALQKVVYLFLLRHPEGVAQNCFGDHYEELLELYRHVSQAESEGSMMASIRAICNHPLDNSLNEKISRIRKVIKDILGEALGSQYQISGAPGAKRRIPLERGLVEWR